MNINSSKPPQGRDPNQSAHGAQNVKHAAVEKQKAAAPANANTADRVDISGRTREVADIQSAVNQLPEIRTDKVEEIKKAVESGAYTVDPAKVAQSILKSI